MKVILLAETKGESAEAVPYYADGMGMAAEELGEQGRATRASPRRSPRTRRQTALLQAIDQKPNLIIGFPAELADHRAPADDRELGHPDVPAVVG